MQLRACISWPCSQLLLFQSIHSQLPWFRTFLISMPSSPAPVLTVLFPTGWCYQPLSLVCWGKVSLPPHSGFNNFAKIHTWLCHALALKAMAPSHRPGKWGAAGKGPTPFTWHTMQVPGKLGAQPFITYCWAGVSYTAEQLSHCDLLKMSAPHKG